MLAIKKRFVALEDEKNDERDGYKAEASADQPITVMSHKVAAVVTPVTSRSRLTTAPAPMNPFVQFRVGSRRDDATPGMAGCNFRAYKNCLHS
jgi:hypothetical protein